MNTKRDLPALPLKALYTIPELMVSTGVSRRRLRTLLDNLGVELVVAGRTVYVPLSEIQRRLPPLWRQIALMYRVSRGEVDDQW